MGIYNKTTGAAISTVTLTSLWAGATTGTPCDTTHNGDPTVIYDPQGDRFIVADFAWTSLQNGPYYECIAVSKTSNPVTGGWWLFGFRADDAAHPWLPDYPKMGIWPDGLYMSANMFDCLSATCAPATNEGVRAYAFNLSDLESGAVLRSVTVDVTGGTGPFHPASQQLSRDASPRREAKLFCWRIRNSLRLGGLQVHPELCYASVFDIYRPGQRNSGQLRNGGQPSARASSW